MGSTEARKKICQHIILKGKHWKQVVLGGWMLWHQKFDILWKSGNKVNVRFYPSATTDDMTSHLRPVMRKKLDAIIIYADSTDLTSDVSTMKYVRSIIKIIEQMNGGDNIQIEFSGIIERRDHDLSEKIKDINGRLTRYCDSKSFSLYR